MAIQISKAAFDLCVRHEVTSEKYYVAHYQRPEWPGLASGVTVGIGYDLGQASREKIRQDWTGLVTADMLLIMMSCSGYTGQSGKAKLMEVRSKILIPWDKALHVFANRDVPTWTAGVLAKVPGAEKLPADCLGVLFDLAYNRGHSWSMAGERYREMRAIKAHVATGNWALVPGEIRSMKRLWPNTAGLLRRCDDRAALWQQGLKAKAAGTPTVSAPVPTTPAATDPRVPTNAGPARTQPPTTTTAQNTTTGTIIAGGAAGAGAAYSEGAIGGATAIGIAIAAALVGAVLWYVWHRRRNPT